MLNEIQEILKTCHWNFERGDLPGAQLCSTIYIWTVSVSKNINYTNHDITNSDHLYENIFHKKFWTKLCLYIFMFIIFTCLTTLLHHLLTHPFTTDLYISFFIILFFLFKTILLLQPGNIFLFYLWKGVCLLPDFLFFVCFCHT